jgi:hypothetical protein
LGFLTLFAVLVVMVSHFYLLPAMVKAQHATHDERRAMSAHALLLMAVLLTILVCGLLLTFRIGRFFFPRPTPAPPTRTPYVDAWAEAGRRAKLGGASKAEDGDEEDGDEEADEGPAPFG